MRDFIEICKSMIVETQSARRSDELAGWWIDNHGRILEVDHRSGQHHAQIAMDELGYGEETEDEGDHALAQAKAEGWVRGSYNNTHLTVGWSKDLSEMAERSLMNWMREFGQAFSSYYFNAPNGVARFDNFRETMKWLNREFGRVNENLLEAFEDHMSGEHIMNGFWLTADGRVLQVKGKDVNTGHERIADEEFGTAPGKGYMAALEAGWIRCSFFDVKELVANFIHTVSPRTLKKLASIVRSGLDFETYTVEGPDISAPVKSFQDKPHFLRHLNALADGMRAQVSEALMEGYTHREIYAAWIDADGREIACSNHAMVEVAEDSIRVSTSDCFEAEWSESTPAAFKKLSRIIRENGDYDAYYINGIPMLSKRQALATVTRLSRD